MQWDDAQKVDSFVADEQAYIAWESSDTADRTVAETARDWIEVYPLPWNLFIWKAAHCATTNYEYMRDSLSEPQRQIMDALAANLFATYEIDGIKMRPANPEGAVEDSSAVPAKRLSPGAVRELLGIAKDIDYVELAGKFPAKTPDWYMKDSDEFTTYIKDWITLLERAAGKPGCGIVLFVD